MEKMTEGGRKRQNDIMTGGQNDRMTDESKDGVTK
jgi:hypothetical protein